MAFPVIATHAATYLQPSGGSSSNATLPSSIAAGDLLVCQQSANNATARSTPTGWTLLGTTSNGTRRMWLFARVATADSGDDFLMDRSAGDCVLGVSIMRITDWFGSLSGLDATLASDSGGFVGVNFGSKSPSWGSADTLWILGSGYQASATTNPTNYTDAYYHSMDGFIDGNEAWYRNLAASSEDPPVVADGTLAMAFFLAVQPAGGGGSSVGAGLSAGILTGGRLFNGLRG